jgi:sialate O-acetylesterase
MLKRSMLRFAASLVAIVGCSVSADVKLANVFTDHMVLQRQQPIAVWGTAEPQEQVTVAIGENQASTAADGEGKWRVELPAMESGEAVTLRVRGKNEIELKDVLLGEVWLCSGQSNMEMGLASTEGGAEECAQADYPEIRLFHVRGIRSSQLREDVESVDGWRRCTAEHVGSFSAVAYYFAKEIHGRLGVPVGVIGAAVGGSSLEDWCPPEGIALMPSLNNFSVMIEQANAAYQKEAAERLDEIEAWVSAARQAQGEGRPLPMAPVWPEKNPLDEFGRPTGFYHGMIRPLIPYGIRGAIWYQGESNVGDGMIYYDKMQALIGGWRQLWGQGDFPFYYVQLAPFRYSDDSNPGAQFLPEMWEAQTEAMRIANTGMVVTHDTLTNITDIHPLNKRDVGKRLSLWALAKTYGVDGLEYSGPMYRSMEVEGEKVRIYFDHVGSGLASRDGRDLTWFEVGGAEGFFVRAFAEIAGETVVVWSPQIPSPTQVRFGWNQLAQPNLVNKEGLPAGAFRTK